MTMKRLQTTWIDFGPQPVLENDKKRIKIFDPRSEFNTPDYGKCWREIPIVRTEFKLKLKTNPKDLKDSGVLAIYIDSAQTAKYSVGTILLDNENYPYKLISIQIKGKEERQWLKLQQITVVSDEWNLKQSLENAFFLNDYYFFDNVPKKIKELCTKIKSNNQTTVIENNGIFYLECHGSKDISLADHYNNRGIHSVSNNDKKATIFLMKGNQYENSSEFITKLDDPCIDYNFEMTLVQLFTSSSIGQIIKVTECFNITCDDEEHNVIWLTDFTKLTPGKYKITKVYSNKDEKNEFSVVTIISVDSSENIEIGTKQFEFESPLTLKNDNQKKTNNKLIEKLYEDNKTRATRHEFYLFIYNKHETLLYNGGRNNWKFAGARQIKSIEKIRRCFCHGSIHGTWQQMQPAKNFTKQPNRCNMCYEKVLKNSHEIEKRLKLKPDGAERIKKLWKYFKNATKKGIESKTVKLTFSNTKEQLQLYDPF